LVGRRGLEPRTRWL